MERLQLGKQWASRANTENAPINPDLDFSHSLFMPNRYEDIGYESFKVPEQWQNFILAKTDIEVNTIAKGGFPSWHNSVRYLKGAICRFQSKFYIAIQDSINVVPDVVVSNSSLGFGRFHNNFHNATFYNKDSSTVIQKGFWIEVELGEEGVKRKLKEVKDLIEEHIAKRIKDPHNLHPHDINCYTKAEIWALAGLEDVYAHINDFDNHDHGVTPDQINCLWADRNGSFIGDVRFDAGISLAVNKSSLHIGGDGEVLIGNSSDDKNSMGLYNSQPIFIDKDGNRFNIMLGGTTENDLLKYLYAYVPTPNLSLPFGGNLSSFEAGKYTIKSDKVPKFNSNGLVRNKTARVIITGIPRGSLIAWFYEDGVPILVHLNHDLPDFELYDSIGLGYIGLNAEDKQKVITEDGIAIAIDTGEELEVGNISNLRFYFRTLSEEQETYLTKNPTWD